MRGHGVRGVLAENMMAINPLLESERRMNTSFRMCWKCQKDKSTTGGRMVIKPGLHMFVCRDCEDAKRAAKEKSTEADK